MQQLICWQSMEQQMGIKKNLNIYLTPLAQIEETVSIMTNEFLYTSL